MKKVCLYLMFSLILSLNRLYAGDETPNVEKALDSTWKALTQLSICTAAMDFEGLSDGNSSSMFRDCSYRNTWDALLSFDRNLLSSFLLKKIPVLKETNIHNCPCYNQRECEVAVEALTAIYHVQWYELLTVKKWYHEDIHSCADNIQVQLWKIVRNPKKRTVLIKAWQEVISRVNKQAGK